MFQSGVWDKLLYFGSFKLSSILIAALLPQIHGKKYFIIDILSF